MQGEIIKRFLDGIVIVTALAGRRPLPVTKQVLHTGRWRYVYRRIALGDAVTGLLCRILSHFLRNVTHATERADFVANLSFAGFLALREPHFLRPRELETT